MHKGSRVSGRGRKSARRAKQIELPFRNWGGARKGAGRKPKGERALNPHRARPGHAERFPVLVTTRLQAGLPSLRRPSEAARIRVALAQVNERSEKDEDFRVVHHSIQSNHLHLIVEAADRRALSRGTQGLLVRIARALNRLWRRSGSVFADRFHERELRNPRQVRNALVYVLQNLRKHGIRLASADPYSSGPEFDGWITGRAPGSSWIERAGRGRLGGDSASRLEPLRRAMRAATPSAKTWLLGVGWSRHGLIDPGESPRRG